MLLLPDARLAERRQATSDGELGRLYESLSAELEPLIRTELYIPREKAVLSREGGRCADDGSLLEFDPFEPRKHRCPRCGKQYEGELHFRAWIMPYQLWLAERAVHAALFFALRGETRHAQLARRILDGYAEQYHEYPNVDNVLGPSRLFFSTYLESIWLLQICVAADLLRAAGDAAIHGRVADRIIEPSRRLIAEYDEGMSNRQVWNNAAMIAAAASLDDTRAFDERVQGRASSLTGHLSRALLGDATWYEGENYHQFALRGLWYGVTVAETRGLGIDAKLRDRFDRAFETLYLTALPDFTIPSRKDSQYQVSLRQWRVAELAELGFARRSSPILASALARTYEPGHARVDTGRARSTADAERNGPGGALSRADLGWRALLHAVPRFAPTTPRAPQSVLLEQQGLAVFRRAPDAYVSLDYGRYGGGHGHPDRLNVTVSVGPNRLLDDLGTGSYVDPSLHWYRSTLAHNAPLVNGRSQSEQDGSLVAHDERGALGWTVAAVEWPEHGVRIERAVVVAPEYFVDELHWTASEDVRVDLPWHLDADSNVAFKPAVLEGGNGLEDGFRFVKESAASPVPGGTIAELSGMPDSPARAWLVADRDTQLFRGSAPAQPATQGQRFYVLQGSGREGRMRAVVAWADVTGALFRDDGAEVALADGSRHVHRRDATGWHVELFAMGARSSVDLAGFRGAAPRREPSVPSNDRAVISLPSRGLTFELGEEHYRRSEVSWREAGEPSAAVAITPAASKLTITVRVRARDQRFVPADAANRYDNEHADTMGAGIQVYLRTPEGRGGWMLVPEPGGTVRKRVLQGWSDLARTPTSRWAESPDGYEMTVDLPLSHVDVELDVLINESTARRERRRGQLVLSGASGEFVYLRGDRHDEDRLLKFRIEP